MELAMVQQKASLRRKFRDLRGGLPHRELEDSVRALSRHLERWIRDYTSSDTQIAFYSPKSEEARFELPGPVESFFFPRVEGEKLRFFRPTHSEAFEVSRLGIREPLLAGAHEIDSDRSMVIFCPAVAVDSEGRRLGQGRGHYDRFFSAVPRATRVGVVYQIQVSMDPLPADSRDQRLDWIVTEKMILRTSKRSF